MLYNRCKNFFHVLVYQGYFRSDNGPQYCSHEFKRFSDEWGFDHITSSPTFPQSNGLAEKTVQTLKTLLEKACQAEKDPYLSILEYHNNPLDWRVHQHSYQLMARKLEDLLSLIAKQLQRQVINPKKAQN